MIGLFGSLWRYCLFHREVPPHPNIVQMLGISMTGPQPTIVLEYCAGG
jgi:hypothetical protein